MALDDFVNVKIYEPRNLGSVPGYVYLGKTNSVAGQKQTVPEDQRENCFSVFLWASVVGGINVRVDPPTDVDPYTFIDQKWYDLRPYKYWFQWRDAVKVLPEQEKLQDYYAALEPLLDDEIPFNNIMPSRTEMINDTDPIYRIRNLTSDGSVVIDANGGRYWWGSDGSPHGDPDNSNPTDELVLKVNDYKLDCLGTGTSVFIGSGPEYIIRRIKGIDNVSVYNSEGYSSPTLGTIAEDYSDLLPECTIKVVYEGPCTQTEDVDESLSYGGDNIDDNGGFWIGNTSSVDQSSANVFPVTELVSSSTTYSISGGDSVLTLRAILPDDYDWFKNKEWYSGSEEDTVNIVWKFNSADAYIKNKSGIDLMNELGDFYDIDTTGLTIEEFEPLLSDAVDAYTGEAGTYTGIKNIQRAVDSKAVAELVWVGSGDLKGRLDLIVLVNNLYSYKWSTTLAITL